MDSSLDFWLTTGRYAERFEKEFALFLGAQHCSLTNSGSSANLLAFMALTSPKLGDRRIMPGDEVITVAAGFPTTVAPIIQYGAVPVFVDVSLPAYNVDCTQLEGALSDRTKAVMLAHTLGNPFDLQRSRRSATGTSSGSSRTTATPSARVTCINGEWRYTGTIGHLGTSSFYPPHHMTMGEGGAVYTDDTTLKRLVESFRDWGRDCWCPSGEDNTCGNRFTQQFGETALRLRPQVRLLPLRLQPEGDRHAGGHRLCPAGEAPGLHRGAQAELASPPGRACRPGRPVCPAGADAGSDPSWFGFLLTVREEAGFTRERDRRTTWSGRGSRPACFSPAT